MFIIELAFGHNSPTGEGLSDTQITLAEHKVLVVFAQCFGGSQRYHALGSYHTADHRLVTELCTVIRAYTPEIAQHWDTLQALAREIACQLTQECVLLSCVQLHGSLAWIAPNHEK